MRVTVTREDGHSDTFGDVMGLKMDAETMFLTVDYEISSQRHNGVFVKAYGTGEWKSAEIVNEPPRISPDDFGTPVDPV